MIKLCVPKTDFPILFNFIPETETELKKLKNFISTRDIDEPKKDSLQKCTCIYISI